MDRCLDLNDGQRLPAVGFGTFRLQGGSCTDAVRAALKCGYRLIDTASIYKNESDIGVALAEHFAASRATESVFVTSKVSPYDMGYDKCLASVKVSLERLRLPCLDLVLLHWPAAARLAPGDTRNAELRLQSWRALLQAQRLGLVRSIGVSNFTPDHLEHIAAETSVTPAVNQIELHPMWQQQDTVECCARMGVVVQAYSSLAQGALLHHADVVSACQASGCSAAQVCLSWALAKGYAVVPRSADPSRIAENATAATLYSSMDREVLSRLDALSAVPKKFCWDPSGVM